jgi:lactate racemase
VSGPRILNFFHWLGAVVTNPMIIGNKWTPVRRVVDRAGAMVSQPKLCFCLVTQKGGLAGIYAGTPEAAWDAASELSRRLHITCKEHPFKTILSCAPAMYDELWTGGKCMYKLEPVLADGGELIIYAPHIREVCVSHGKALLEVGYHCRDYFLKQWDRFKDYPWGALAHSTHVFGLGTYENGVETPRARVSRWPLASLRKFAGRSISATATPRASERKISPTASTRRLARPRGRRNAFSFEKSAAWAGGIDSAAR